MKQHNGNLAEQLSPARVFSQSEDAATWVGEKQAAALEHLCSRARIRVLVGPSSSGKSSILRQFKQQAQDTVLLPVIGPQQSALGVLTALIASASLDFWTLSETEQRNLLTVFMEHRRFQGKRIVVCVDNVSKFSTEAWNEIQRLTQLRVDAQPLIELVVAASEKEVACAPLDRFLLSGNTSPIESLHFLHAPSEEDLVDYIGWRLAKLDVEGVFPPEVCSEIARRSDGRFDTVNKICRLLLQGRSPETKRIDKEAVGVALSKLAELKKASNGSSASKPEPSKTNGTQNGIDVAGRLTVSQNGETCGEFPLVGSIRIGRRRDSHIRLNSRVISRHHATVARGPNGRYFIFDCDSKNGTLVNGTFAKGRVLQDGDVINLGEFCIRVELFETVVAIAQPDDSKEPDIEGSDLLPTLDQKVDCMSLTESAATADQSDASSAVVALKPELS